LGRQNFSGSIRINLLPPDAVLRTGLAFQAFRLIQPPTTMSITIRHDEEAQQFTALLEKEDIGELAYAMPEPDVIDFQHTFIESEHRGKGFADQLIQQGLDYAADKKYKVRASCPAVANYMEKHPQ
jgi:predicted GNAT family acetyltransferase